MTHTSLSKICKAEAEGRNQPWAGRQLDKWVVRPLVGPAPAPILHPANYGCEQEFYTLVDRKLPIKYGRHPISHSESLHHLLTELQIKFFFQTSKYSFSPLTLGIGDYSPRELQRRHRLSPRHGPDEITLNYGGQGRPKQLRQQSILSGSEAINTN